MSDDISADPRSASFLATNTKPNKEVPNDYYQHTNPETLYILPIKRAVILEFESDTGFETQYEISSQQKGFIYRAGAEYLQRSSEILTGWVSPRHEITLAKDSRKAAGIPRKAKYYSFLHPPKGLADYIEWAKVTNNDDYALSYIASFGAYVYFDKNSEIICVNVITMKKTEFKLKCEGPFIAANDAYEKIDALNRFQPLHIDAFREVGFVGSAWIEPNEDEYLDSCHTGLRCHHGAFLYFRRDKTAVVFLVLGLDEDTTTPKYQVGSLIVDAFRLCKHELERKHTLATTCAKSFTETVSRSMNFDETNNIVLRNASSLDAIDHVSSILPEVKDFDFGWSPLHYACCYFPRDLKLIKKVYQSNPDALYAKTVNDLYPIHLACQNAPSLDVIKVLTEHDEEKHTLHGQSKHHGLLPIHFACSNAMTNFDVIQHLINEDRKHRASKFNIKGYDIDKLSPRVSTLHHASILGWTALHRAVCCNHSYEVLREIILPSNTEYFVEKNYDLLGLEANRMLPIHIACLRGCSKSTIAFLLNADSTQGHLNFFRRVTCIEYNLEESTTLHIALAYAPTDAIDLVLNIVTKACIDKDEKKQLCDMTETHDYMLPIHVACARKSVSADVIKTLLRLNGEGIFQRDKNGNTPLHLLFQNEINDERKVQILLDTASSMETPSSRHFITKLTNNKQETPFMIALKNKIKGAYELMNPNYVCLKSMHDDEKLEMLELILKTKQFRNHLVKNLSQRMYFALIMFELIAIVVTTAMYINLSSSIVLDTGVYITMVEIIVLSIYATYALTREVMKLSGNEAWDYIADGWNWVECFSLVRRAIQHEKQFAFDLFLEKHV
jgi:ankyrin repeat protein